ncbi:BrnA antitoxin family protein [candidate division KSB1 bacterium]|nr:BrnA antitoxin family protein [candidate division KSB1 bacterium]
MPKLKKDSKRPHTALRKKALKPIPNFKSLEEEARFWDTHDTTEYAWEDLDEPIEIGGPLKASVEKRRAERLAALLKLEPKHLRATQRIARRKGVTSDALIKIWINEGLRREAARV